MNETKQGGELVIPTTRADQSISQKLGLDLSPEQVAVIKANIAKGVNDTELAYFLSLAKSVNLNPFTKQIWCYKDHQGNLLVFAGRDGFLANAHRHPDFSAIRSAEVCENDFFEPDIPNGKISHSFKSITREARGQIVGAYAIVLRHDKEASIVVVEFKTYNRGVGAWKTHPADMICKVAETKALKKAYGLELQSEYEYDVRNEVAIPIDTGRVRTQADEWRDMLLQAFEAYTGDDKEDLRQMAAAKFMAGEADEKFVGEMLTTLSAKADLQADGTIPFTEVS